MTSTTTSMGFTIVHPSLLTRFDLDADVDAQLRAAISPVVQLASVSQQPTLRAVLEDGVARPVRALAEGGAVAAFLAIGPFDPSPVRPVMSMLPLPEVVGPAGVRVVESAAADASDTRILEFGDFVGVRIESQDDAQSAVAAFLAAHPDLVTAPSEVSAPVDRSAPAPPPPLTLEPVPAGHRRIRVEYIFGDPADDAVTPWMAAQVTFVHPDNAAGRELATGWCGIFDAMVATFRWSA